MSKSKENEKEDNKKSTVERVKESFTGKGKNINAINTVGRDHRIESVITEDGKLINYKDFHKHIDKYTVANLDPKEKPFELVEQGGKIKFKDSEADLVGFTGVKENWNPNIEPQIPA